MISTEKNTVMMITFKIFVLQQSLCFCKCKIINPVELLKKVIIQSQYSFTRLLSKFMFFLIWLTANFFWSKFKQICMLNKFKFENFVWKFYLYSQKTINYSWFKIPEKCACLWIEKSGTSSVKSVLSVPTERRNAFR